MNVSTKKRDFKSVSISNGRALNLVKVCSQSDQGTFVNLCQEYNDIFAFTYEHLTGFDTILDQHTIELDPNTKPVRQKKRPINPKIEPFMRKDLSKFIESSIIFPIKHSSWVANLVPVRNKNG